MKADRPPKQPESRKPGQHEARVFNRLSALIHGGISGTASNIRLSLTLRIASHYCFQLLRSAVLCTLVLTFSFGVGVYLELSPALDRISSQPADLPAGEYSQLIIQNSRITARQAEIVSHEKWTDRLSFHLYTLVSDHFPVRMVFCLFHRPYPVRITLDVRDYALIWVVLLCGGIAADLLRMLYFLRKRRRLDRRVLAPIREMTEMAQTLSAANLSNRINIAGTKNELRDLAVVINSMLDRIERSYNSQKQFVSDASHELRTPIAVIRGYTDMLRRWGKDDPEVLEEGIGAISQEAENMKNLVENLLFLARHDKKTLMLEMENFDALELLKEVQRESGMVTQGDRFVIQPAESVFLKADRGLIKQLLRILVDNAVKYSAEGSEITLGVHSGPSSCILQVSDHGCGIPAQDLPKIFERFYRADTARHSEAGGHGLGLSIARIIVIAHSGSIRVRSKVQGGTTFEITLPLSPDLHEKTEA